MFVKFIFSILSLILLFSCGGKVERTPTNFKLSFVTDTNAGHKIAGGVLLLGVNSQKQTFSKNLSGDSTVEVNIEVPNGEWSFYAIAWEENSGMNMSGKVRCAFSENKILDGSSEVVDVNLTLSNANCSSPTISDGRISSSAGTTEVRFPNVKISSCRNDKNIATSTACSKTNGDRGFVRSYRFQLDEFSTLPATEIVGVDFSQRHLLSQCFPINDGIDSAITSAASALNIPHGLVRSTIVAYSDSSCTKKIQSVTLNDGLKVPATLNSVKVINAGADTIIKHIMSPALFCSINNDRTVFSTGNGSMATPYGICFAEQMKIPTSGTAAMNDLYMSQNFELLQDIDLSSMTVAFPGATSIPLCSEPGNNFIPWGGFYTDPTNDCSLTVSVPTPFSGVFNGNGHRIKNLFIMSDRFDNVGLVRTLNGTMTNIIFENPQIEGGRYTGTVAGLAQGGEISNISVYNGNIEGESSDNTTAYVGGIVGESAAVIMNSHVHKTEVSGRGSYIGGIAGGASVNVDTVSFSGEIEGHEDSTNYVGGIVGYQSSGIISNATSKGVVSARGSYIGGIAGFSQGVLDVYSTASVGSTEHKGDGTAVNIGGLIGYQDNGATLNRAIFAGSIIKNCNNSPQTSCSIGESVGGRGTSTSLADVYAIDYGIASIYGGTAGTSMNYTSLLGVDYSSWLGTGRWNMVAGDMPRLIWEALDCSLPANTASVSTQIANQRGSVQSPIIICNALQFNDIASNSDFHYRLGQDIYLGMFSTPINFSGSLDGFGYSVYGAELGSLTGNDIGIFSKLNASGVIKNLNLINIHANYTAGTTNTAAILVGENSGVVSNIRLSHSLLDTTALDPGQAGIVTGFNIGTVEDVRLDYTEVKGTMNYGGVVGVNLNSGIVRRVSSYGYMPLISGANNVGGIVGANLGLIQEASYGGHIDISMGSGIGLVGGIVGDNLTGGRVIDSIFKDHGEIMIKDPSAFAIGGIAGNNDGSIERIVTVGNMIQTEGTSNSSIGPVIGTTSSGTMTNALFVKKVVTINAHETNVSTITNMAPCNIDIASTPSMPMSTASLRFQDGQVIQGTLTGTTFNSSDSCPSVAANDPVRLELPNNYNIDFTSYSTNCEINMFSSIPGFSNSNLQLTVDNTSAGYEGSVVTGKFVFATTSNQSCDYVENLRLNGNSSAKIYPIVGNSLGIKADIDELGNLSYFCPSVASHPTSDKGSFRCDSSESWDIVEDKDDGYGFDSLVSLFMSETMNTPNSNPPIWSLEDEGRGPRLLFEW